MHWADITKAPPDYPGSAFRIKINQLPQCLISVATVFQESYGVCMNYATFEISKRVHIGIAKRYHSIPSHNANVGNSIYTT